MTNEHPDRQTPNSDDETTQALSVPRWAVIATFLIVLLPVLIMSSMMVVMGWVGPLMPGGMAASGPALFPVIGVISLLLVLGVVSSVYRRYEADKE